MENLRGYPEIFNSLHPWIQKCQIWQPRERSLWQFSCFRVIELHWMQDRDTHFPCLNVLDVITVDQERDRGKGASFITHGKLNGGSIRRFCRIISKLLYFLSPLITERANSIQVNVLQRKWLKRNFGSLNDEWWIWQDHSNKKSDL